jgi:hypothetical protein
MALHIDLERSVRAGMEPCQARARPCTHPVTLDTSRIDGTPVRAITDESVRIHLTRTATRPNVRMSDPGRLELTPPYSTDSDSSVCTCSILSIRPVTRLRCLTVVQPRAFCLNFGVTRRRRRCRSPRRRRCRSRRWGSRNRSWLITLDAISLTRPAPTLSIPAAIAAVPVLSRIPIRRVWAHTVTTRY